jgi:hypothetical protein
VMVRSPFVSAISSRPIKSEKPPLFGIDNYSFIRRFEKEHGESGPS